MICYIPPFNMILLFFYADRYKGVNAWIVIYTVAQEHIALVSDLAVCRISKADLCKQDTPAEETVWVKLFTSSTKVPDSVHLRVPIAVALPAPSKVIVPKQL